MSSPDESQTGELCPHCGADLPAGHARFCIECGMGLPDHSTVRLAEPDVEPHIPPATGVTVRLANARVEQSVVGGTVKLATAGAVPPGLWMADDPPGADDVVAVYVPLRAIVGGWSGLIDAGWALVQQLAPERGSTSPRFRFEATREWFAGPGFGGGLRLVVRIQAEAEAVEGRTRRGFRYQANHDQPMAVVESWWAGERGERVERPMPRIQLMAPPRVPRISDYDEQIRVLPASRAAAWAREGRIHEAFHLLQARQQRTPAGRGLILGAVDSLGLLAWLFKPEQTQLTRHYVRFSHPLVCSWKDWEKLQPRIRAQARTLGLELETDATIEWWLDQQGHDALVLDGANPRYPYKRIAIAFRRAQIAQVEGA